MTGEERLSGVAVPDAVARAVRRIYEASFPRSQRIEMTTILASVAAGERALWVKDDGVAFAVTSELGTADRDVLLEYLVVDGPRRSTGLGGAMLDAVVRAAGGPVVLEVEDPARERIPEAAARLRFYQRHHATPLPCSVGYAMPDLADDGLSPLLLLELAAERRRPVPAAAVAAEVVRAIWGRAYDRPADDPLLRAVLGGLSCEGAP